MKTYITNNFLLHSSTARELYHEIACDLPIFDYHSHLPAYEIASDRRFQNISELWLSGDHYKWRAMRSHGIPERFCTGDATPKEKFFAWARTVPATLRNPLYHWTHLELLRYFEIDDLLDDSTAESIWERINEKLASPEFSASQLLAKRKVIVVCTTDDPVDDLASHRFIQEKGILSTRVFPTFRPDKAFALGQPAIFTKWLEELEFSSGRNCAKLSGFLDALDERHAFFHEQGCRLSDHGLMHCFAEPCSTEDAGRIFENTRAGREPTISEQHAFAAYLMIFFGRLDAKRGWVKQLHLGALRNNNTRISQLIGPDAGCDSIGDWPQAQSLSRYLDTLDQGQELPKMILYNLNPADNYVFGAMIGNFQDGLVPGKIQFGTGWWFLDQKEGMEWQINTLSHLGLLSHFIGMTTDSRSFLSYSRHEYFRRIFCNLVGAEVDRGELPRDMDLLARLVRNVCYENAVRYFDLIREPKGPIQKS